MKKNKETKRGWQFKYVVAVLVATSFVVSLFYRIVLPYGKVFVGDWIKFTGNDAYRYMRLVDSLVYNFPKLTFFDPYFIAPNGGVVGGSLFFAWLLSSITWIIGLGSPTQYTIDVVSVYSPAVLGALVVVPTYFIGKSLFNKWVGVISAFLIAVLPGEFLGRSILGETDHHVAEVLFSAVAVMFLIMAIRGAGKKSIVYSLLSGLFLGIYLLTWMGGLLFVFIITLYFILQVTMNHLCHKSSMHLAIVVSIAFLVGVAMNIFTILSQDIKLAMLIALTIPLALSSLSWLMLRNHLKIGYYPMSLFGLGTISLGVLYLVMPNVIEAMLANFGVFGHIGSTAATTLELQPILFPQGVFSFNVAWGNFTTSLYLFPLAFAILTYMAFRRKFQEQGWLLLLVWSLAIVVLTLMQRRYAYYLAVNIALLMGFLSYQCINLVMPRLSLKNKKSDRVVGYFNIALVSVMVFLVVILPNFFMARLVAGSVPFAPSDDWQESLLWMKNNTPEPFGNSSAYYEYIAPPTVPNYKYPEARYGVTAWWDYGYWITRIAHRVPSANPAQNPIPIKQVADLFLSQNMSFIETTMGELKSKYVVLDSDTVGGKYYALINWSGQSQNEYYGIYYIADGEQLKPAQLFYPKYYQSLAVRLFSFEGKAVTDIKPAVISYVDDVSREGVHYRRITNGQQFSRYEDAIRYMVGLKSDKVLLVGTDPRISPIALDALSDFSLIHVSSPNKGVKIFEYDGK